MTILKNLSNKLIRFSYNHYYVKQSLKKKTYYCSLMDSLKTYYSECKIDVQCNRTLVAYKTKKSTKMNYAPTYQKAYSRVQFLKPITWRYCLWRVICLYFLYVRLFPWTGGEKKGKKYKNHLNFDKFLRSK